MCNLQKAFDCESHKILLSKLKYGITDKHYELYRSYLDGRYQRTALSSVYNNNKLLSRMGKKDQWSPTRVCLGMSSISHICMNDLPNNV